LGLGSRDLVIKITKVSLDLFDFFRYALAWVASIYATIVSLQSLYTWWVWLAGQDKYISLVRRYVIVHGLRLRVRAFLGDVLVCLLLCVALGVIWVAHSRMNRLRVALETARQVQAAVIHRPHP
jgi:hypothetical protein